MSLEMDFEGLKIHPTSSCGLCFVLAVQVESSQLPAAAATPPLHDGFHLSGGISHNDLFLLYAVAGLGLLSQQ